MGRAARRLGPRGAASALNGQALQRHRPRLRGHGMWCRPCVDERATAEQGPVRNPHYSSWERSRLAQSAPWAWWRFWFSM